MHTNGDELQAIRRGAARSGEILTKGIVSNVRFEIIDVSTSIEKTIQVVEGTVACLKFKKFQTSLTSST
jgi:hypothetical protein